jgi:hypothetical protein
MSEKCEELCNCANCIFNHSKTCRRCKEIKPFDLFHFKNKSKGTREARCKECLKEINKKRYEVLYSSRARNTVGFVDLDK